MLNRNSMSPFLRQSFGEVLDMQVDRKGPHVRGLWPSYAELSNFWLKFSDGRTD